MNRKERRATKAKIKKSYKGLPYENYSIGVSEAAREVIEPVLCDHKDTDNITVRELIKVMATDTYREKGMPPMMAGQFQFGVRGVSLTVQIDQGEQSLACWVSEESDNGKVPVIIMDSEDCPYCNGTLPAPEGHGQQHTVH
jgi:hypothetical protein